jgi:hypothetical protein
LLASDGTEFDTLGVSVALAGGAAAVGTSRNNERGTDAGAVYVFARSGASWTQQAKLTAADSAGNENFGTSVAGAGVFARRARSAQISRSTSGGSPPPRTRRGMTALRRSPYVRVFADTPEHWHHAAAMRWIGSSNVS